MIPLFQHYPSLKNTLPHTSLGEFPTPIEKLDQLGEDLNLNHIYIKRDDLSGQVYGGNKVRKLEFILADALNSGAEEVLTFGYAGSNHALATAIYAQQLGMENISLLLSQPNAHYVRNNLLLSAQHGAELHHHQNLLSFAAGTVYQFLRHTFQKRKFPRIIFPGGSSPLGTVGYVNAAFELKEQIEKEKIPEPDFIYVALGSMGTAVGLTLGLKATNLKTQVVPILVVDKKFANKRTFAQLFRKTNSLLCSADSSFPKCELPLEDINILNEFFGKKYALFTEEGMEAVATMEKSEGIKLEGTYTGKTLAALIKDAKNKKLRDKVILFWNTYNSRDNSTTINNIDYRQLPKSFHQYFEEDVQTLELNPTPQPFLPSRD